MVGLTLPRRLTCREPAGDTCAALGEPCDDDEPRNDADDINGVDGMEDVDDVSETALENCAVGVGIAGGAGGDPLYHEDFDALRNNADGDAANGTDPADPGREQPN